MNNMKYLIQGTDEMDIIICTRSEYIFEPNTNYNQGDEISIKEVPVVLSITFPDRDSYGNITSYSKVNICEHDIKRILDKLKEIDLIPIMKGTYEDLPF